MEKEKELEEAIKELLEGKIRVKVGIEKIVEMKKTQEKKKGKMIWVRLTNEKEKRKIMEGKSKLRGKEERIEDDMTSEGEREK